MEKQASEKSQVVQHIDCQRLHESPQNPWAKEIADQCHARSPRRSVSDIEKAAASVAKSINSGMGTVAREFMDFGEHLLNESVLGKSYTSRSGQVESAAPKITSSTGVADRLAEPIADRVKAQLSARNVNGIAGLDGRKPVDRIIAAIMGPDHENANFTTITPNDNGYGVSFGGFQFNQQVGQLPMLMHNIAQRDRTACERVFGKDFTRTLLENPEALRKMDKHKLANQLREASKDEGWAKVNREAQLAIMRHAVMEARDIAIKHHVGTSSDGKKGGVEHEPPEKAVALVADIINQEGEKGAQRPLAAAAAAQGQSLDYQMNQMKTHDLKKYNRPHRSDTIIKGPFSDKLGLIEHLFSWLPD
jgi:hypothetical protein